MQKQKKTRVDKCMQELMTYSGHTVWETTEQHVLNFLIFKDTNGSGRTVVHQENCPFLGTRTFTHCKSLAKCGLRHSAESLRTGIFEKIKKGFDQAGRRGEWIPELLQGNPAISTLVKQYLEFVRLEQGLSGVTTSAPKVMSQQKLELLLENMTLESAFASAKKALEIYLCRAAFAFAFRAIKRGSDTINVVASNVLRMPNGNGLVFNFTWGKTLRKGKHVYGIMCEKTKSKWCACCMINQYVEKAKMLGWTFESGYLFPRMDGEGNKMPGRWTVPQLCAKLKSYLKKYFLYEGETTQSFRSGGLVDQLLQGKSLEEAMYIAYMSNPKTAAHYSKILKVMCPRGVEWEKAGMENLIEKPSYDEIDNMPLHYTLSAWRAFKNEGAAL
jgi:hypothetical protein